MITNQISLSVSEANQVSGLLDDVVGYLTDNSCGDPDCCGGPYYNREGYEESRKRLLEFGIEVDG